MRATDTKGILFSKRENPSDIHTKDLYTNTLIHTSMRIKRIVWKNKTNGQKLVTVPKDSDIEAGEYVWIEKAKE